MCARATVWACGSHVVDLATPKVMGILNVTPDSFSDDNGSAALACGLEMVRQGAHIIDVGGESTRPGSKPVSAEEELARIIPVVEALAERGVIVSVDTSKPHVAKMALEAGASIINDITGFRDLQMVSVVSSASSEPGLVIMHMQGTPQTMQEAPHYDDVVKEVASYLQEQANNLERHGVHPSRIAIDPGFGFGKTSAHNLEILRRTGTFVDLGYPLVVAVSRKRTIGEISGEQLPSARMSGSIAAALYAVERGARIARVHDVEETIQAFAMFSALDSGAR